MGSSKKIYWKKGHVLLEDPSSKWGTRNDTQRSTSQEFCALCTLENKKNTKPLKILKVLLYLGKMAIQKLWTHTSTIRWLRLSGQSNLLHLHKGNCSSTP